MEILGQGSPVPYARCVAASTGIAPQPSDPVRKRERVAELLGQPAGREKLLAAVDTWRLSHRIPMPSIRTLGATVIAYFDELSARHVVPHLPPELHSIPRANIQFLPIRDALVLGVDELPGARPPCRWLPGVRSDLRDQRIARNLRARVFATGQP